MGREEIAIAGADVAFGCGARSAAQHELVTHEFAVVFADCASCRRKSRISNVGTRGPLPNVSEHLLQTLTRSGLRTKLLGFKERPVAWYLRSRDFPFIFSWQASLAPVGESIGFVITDVANRGRGIYLSHSVVAEIEPAAI